MDSTEIDRAIGANIRYLRTRHFETQSTLANTLSRTRNAVCVRDLSRWENGCVSVPHWLLVTLARRYDVPYDRLLTGTGLLASDLSIDFQPNAFIHRPDFQRAILQIINVSIANARTRTADQFGHSRWIHKDDAGRFIYWHAPAHLGVLPEQLVDVFVYTFLLPHDHRPWLATTTTHGRSPVFLQSTWVAITPKGYALLASAATDPPHLKLVRNL